MASWIISATVDITVIIDTGHLLRTFYIKMSAYLLAFDSLVHSGCYRDKV